MNSHDLLVGDPDPKLRTALAIMFGHAGWLVRGAENGEAIRAAVLDRTPSCVLIDIHAPLQSCLSAMASLRAEGYTRPIVAMSSLSEPAIIVAAIKHGADDFVQKPCRTETLFETIMRAVSDWDTKQLGQDAALTRQFVGHAMLTRRESDIVRGIAAGSTAREAAALLDISPRTVEFHRARILRKFGARNTAELMRIILRTAGNG